MKTKEDTEIRCLSCGAWIEFVHDIEDWSKTNLSCVCGHFRPDYHSTHSLRTCREKGHHHE